MYARDVPGQRQRPGLVLRGRLRVSQRATDSGAQQLRISAAEAAGGATWSTSGDEVQPEAASSCQELAGGEVDRPLREHWPRQGVGAFD